MTTRKNNRPTYSLRDLLPILLLWGLVIALFWKIALAGRVLAGGDIFTYFYPYWAEATRAIRAGRLPLWNPYLFMGSPFLANSQVGFFYPLNWLLWLLFPAHQSVHLTIVLHLCLAALNGYLWGRVSLKLGQVGAWTVGAVFALGGYLGAQVEHVNQLQGLAWLPLMLILYDQLASRRVGKAAWVGLVMVVGLVFLAGHTQTAFISLVGLAVYGLGPALWRGLRERKWRGLARRMLLLASAVGLGIGLAAVQLVPTWELSRFSVRAGGLPFNERVSFSLSPLYTARALLPSFVGPVHPEHIEYVAYVGIVGLALAVIAMRNFKSKIANPKSSILLAVLGLFLSLGLYNPFYLILARFVPGFAHFRAPARWLTLYALGVAGMAGLGADALWHRRLHSPDHKRIDGRTLSLCAGVLAVLMVWAIVGIRIDNEMQVSRLTGWMMGVCMTLSLMLTAARAPRLATVSLLILLTVELFAASSTLPHSRATAPQAFTSLRPAIAHLLSAEEQAEGAPARFISMSDITFDPGDLAEINVIYGPQLAADALYDYVIAAKHKEVLSPALPLAFGVPAVDGYDGGVLPLARYVTLQRLFLPNDQVSMDGRLRENLTTLPNGRWLNLFNARHIITDKLHDAWLDDVFYDLQFGAQLARGESAAVAHVPQFEATALGLVTYLRGGESLPDDAVVGIVEVGFGDTLTRTFELRAGEHTAEGLYSTGTAHAQAPVGGHFWPGQPEGNDYVTRLRWPEPSYPIRIAIQATLPEGELVIRGVSLIDERTGGFQALVLSDQNRLRLTHSGDVKIYENLDVLPRAFLVRQQNAIVAADELALRLMQAQAFDPSTKVVLASDANTRQDDGQSLGNEDSVLMMHYAAERVEIEVKAQAPSYLILTDAWYPSWEATVDGEPVDIHRADLLFRAVAVDAGSHRVVFSFRPKSVWIGANASLAVMVILVGTAAHTTLSKAKGDAIMISWSDSP
ncbi:MAG: YfhO family protein [Chloroflexi bacterium]|nr:YfhO family protein [Chloroflexota bacterium]